MKAKNVRLRKTEEKVRLSLQQEKKPLLTNSIGRSVQQTVRFPDRSSSCPSYNVPESSAVLTLKKAKPPNAAISSLSLDLLEPKQGLPMFPVRLPVELTRQHLRLHRANPLADRTLLHEDLQEGRDVVKRQAIDPVDFRKLGRWRTVDDGCLGFFRTRFGLFVRCGGCEKVQVGLDRDDSVHWADDEEAGAGGVVFEDELEAVIVVASITCVEIMVWLEGK